MSRVISQEEVVMIFKCGLHTDSGLLSISI